MLEIRHLYWLLMFCYPATNFLWTLRENSNMLDSYCTTLYSGCLTSDSFHASFTLVPSLNKTQMFHLMQNFYSYRSLWTFPRCRGGPRWSPWGRARRRPPPKTTPSPTPTQTQSVPSSSCQSGGCQDTKELLAPSSVFWRQIWTFHFHALPGCHSLLRNRLLLDVYIGVAGRRTMSNDRECPPATLTAGPPPSKPVILCQSKRALSRFWDIFTVFRDTIGQILYVMGIH